MTPEQQRIKIAEACGWRFVITNLWKKDEVFAQCPDVLSCNKLPDYLNDLNAMHEAEATMDPLLYDKWADCLNDAKTSYGRLSYLKMTAPQRAEAFLRTIGKWISH